MTVFVYRRYHGFRYVEVAGLENLEAAQATLVRFRSMAGGVSSVKFVDEPVLDGIQRMALGAQSSNAMTVPTDCPQRDERLGWAGDASLSSDSILANFDEGADFLTSYLDIVVDELGDDDEPAVLVTEEV